LCLPSIENPKLNLSSDMPTQLPPNLSIGCICPREDPRDVLCVHPKLASTCKDIASLPKGSVIGTSSIRRAAQLRRVYPGLKFADLRGNIGTRLAKLDAEDSQYAGIILAAAGLKRLGWEARITQYLSKDNGGMLYAIGQGALAIEVRSNDEAVKELLAKVGSERSSRACLAERALLRTLEGGCSVPIGVETEWRKNPKKEGVATGAEPAQEYGQNGKEFEQIQSDEIGDDEELLLRSVVVSADGKDFVEVEVVRKVGSVTEAEAFGQDIAHMLVAKGADKILEKISKDKQWDAKKRLEAEAK
jgi:hydroxymethylbilane synthase